MKNLKTLTLVLPLALLGSTALSTPALADAKDERIAALESQMQMMMQEIQSLKSERVEEKQAQAIMQQDLHEQLEEIEEKAAAQWASGLAPAAGNADDLKITMAPGPKITKGDFEWQPFGRIHLDAAAFQDDKTDHPDGAEFRRARLGMKGKIAKDFGYKAEIDFANEGVAFKDVYVNYTGIDGVEIKAGSFKPAQGLEEMTSANYLTFIERSAPTSAFMPGEIIGLGASGHGENWSVAGGVFNDDAGVQSTADEALSVTGRLTFAPINDEDSTLHLGGSAAYREPDSATDTFDFDAKAENAVQSADSVSALITTANSATIYGAEIAGVFGPISAQGEYFHVGVDNNAGADSDLSGGYAQAAWTLTGERRPYKAGKGSFGRIVPDRPLDPSNGDWGAVELAARYSTIDLTDGPVSGGEMDSYTAGINWYLNKHFRLMANYIVADTDSSAVTADDDPQILLFRTQADF